MIVAINKVVGNRATQDHFSKVLIYKFSDLTKYKKGYIEMTEKIYLETFEKCSWSLYFRRRWPS